MDINKQNFCSNHVADLTLPGTCCASIFKQRDQLDLGKLTRHPDKAQAGILVVSGDYFIFVRIRVAALPPVLSLDAILSDENLLSYCFDRLLYSDIPLSADLHARPIPEDREFSPKQIHNNI